MRRRLFRVLSVLSLLLCLAFIALWVRSYYVAYSFGWSRSERHLLTGRADSGRLGLVLMRVTRPSPWIHFSVKPGRFVFRPGPPTPNPFSYGGTSLSRHFRFAGLEYVSATGGGNNPYVSQQVWVVPAWLTVVATALLPAAWAARRVTRCRERAAGGCRSCGYDLTGNTSGVCPECGTPTARE